MDRTEQATQWVTIQVKRPEGYEDVCDELVAEDTMQDAAKKGWVWRLMPLLNAVSLPLQEVAEAKRK